MAAYGKDVKSDLNWIVGNFEKIQHIREEDLSRSELTSGGK